MSVLGNWLSSSLQFERHRGPPFAEVPDFGAVRRKLNVNAIRGRRFRHEYRKSLGLLAGCGRAPIDRALRASAARKRIQRQVLLNMDVGVSDMPVKKRGSNRLDVGQHARKPGEFVRVTGEQMKVHGDAGGSQPIEYPLARHMRNNVIVGAVQQAGRREAGIRVRERTRALSLRRIDAILKQTAGVGDAGRTCRTDPKLDRRKERYHSGNASILIRVLPCRVIVHMVRPGGEQRQMRAR